jgi:hypothetical protein
LKPASVLIECANGNLLPIYGETDVILNIEGSGDKVHSVLVADVGPGNSLLGLQTLIEMDTDIDLGSNAITIYGHVIPLRVSRQDIAGCLKTDRTVVIPPNHAIDVPVHIELPSSGKMIISDKILVTPMRKYRFETGLFLAHTVLDTVNSTSAPVTVVNMTSVPVKIKSGETLGIATIAESILPLDPPSDPPSPSPSPGAHRAKECPEPDETLPDLPEHLQLVYDSMSPDLTEMQKAEVKKLLLEYQDIFLAPGGELGRTTLVQHTIDTGDHPPIKQPPRRTAWVHRETMETEIKNMLESGVIEPSNSPWASPVVLVKKKDGSTRFCIDYREINKVTKRDAYPLPRLDDSIESMGGAKWFSTLDLASGYWQVGMDPKDQEKTAFVTRQGLFHFKVMPFGLTNAPATFERLMEMVLRGLQWTHCQVYLDDVIVFGQTFEEALANLRLVFERFRVAHLIMKPKKCELFRKSVSFLGHIVSEEGVSCDPAKIEVIKDWKHPRDLHEVRQFLGFATYYRAFVPHFSTIASPLTALTRKLQAFNWTDECERSFRRLKSALMSSPILAYPQAGLTFILDTDASDSGIGAVLSQVHNGNERVVAYASKSLSRAERNYCTTFKELLAVVKFCKHFKHYLYGSPTIVRTDHASLTWLRNFKNPEGMLARWIATLENMSILDITHRPGVRHVNADVLSRLKPRRPCPRSDCPCCKDDCDLTKPNANVVKQIIAQLQPELVSPPPPPDPEIGLPDPEKENPLGGEDPGFEPIELPDFPVDEWLAQAPFRDLLTKELAMTDSEGYITESDDETELCTMGWAAVSSWTAHDENLPTCRHPETDPLDIVRACAVTRAQSKKPSPKRRGRRRRAPNPSPQEASPPKPVTPPRTRPVQGQPGPPTARPHRPVPPPVSEEPLVRQTNKDGPIDVSNWARQWTHEDVENMQDSDPEICAMIQLLKTHPERPNWKEIAHHSQELKSYWTQWNRMEIRDNVLYRRSPCPYNKDLTIYQIVTPFSLRTKIMYLVHNHKTGGHLGGQKNYSRVKQKFYWPGCKKDVLSWCRKCHTCALIKPGGERKRAPLTQLPVGVPLERIAADFMCDLRPTARGNKNILVISDYYTKWVEAYACPTQTAVEMADKLVTEFICRYGCPLQFHSDQGPCFKAKLMQEVCQSLDIEKTRTVSYRPQSDGHVERFNRTVQDMIRGYVNDWRDDWDLALPYCLMAYRSTRQDSTGCSPNLLMLGREVRTPLDMQFSPGTTGERFSCHQHYSQWMRGVMRDAHHYARLNLGKSAERQKRSYDVRASSRRFEKGDWVYYVDHVGKNIKLGTNWKGPYLVINVRGDVTLDIQFTPRSRVQTVHIDHLKMCHSDHPESWLREPEEPPAAPDLTPPVLIPAPQAFADPTVHIEDPLEGSSRPVNNYSMTTDVNNFSSSEDDAQEDEGIVPNEEYSDNDGSVHEPNEPLNPVQFHDEVSEASDIHLLFDKSHSSQDPAPLITVPTLSEQPPVPSSTGQGPFSFKRHTRSRGPLKLPARYRDWET